MSWDGTDDFATVPIQLPATTFTVSQWIRINEDSSTNASVYVWDARDASNTNGNIFLPAKTAQTTYKLRWYNAGAYRIDNSTNYPIGVWQHVVLVKDGTTGTIYVDGEKLETATGFSSPDNGAEINLGRRYAATFAYGEIELDELAIFSSALTAREVDAIYNNGHPGSLLHHSTLLAHYRMGEGTRGGNRDGDQNLLFDQSKNGGVGSELVSNTDFSSASGWNLDTNASISGGKLVLTGSSGISYVTLDLTDGAAYEVKFTLENLTSGTVKPYLNGTNGTVRSANGTYTEIVLAGSSNTIVGINPSGTMEIDNFSVKKIQNAGTISGATVIPDEGAELVVNGTFSKNKDNWTAENSASLDSVDGKLQVTNPGGGNHGVASQQVTTVSGKTYRAKADLLLSSGTAVDLQFKLGTSSQGTQYYDSGDITSDSTQDVTFTATGTALHITLQNSGNNGTVGYFDNVSVKEITEGVPLQTRNLKPISRGQKALSCDGTDDVVDLGASSKFFSTNTNSISMWFKMPDTSGGEERIFVSNSDAGSSDLRVVISTGGTISVDIWNGSSLVSTTGGSAIDDDIWHHLVYTTSASAQALYIDGVSVATTTHTRSSRAGSVSATIGAYVTGNQYADVDVSDVAIYNVVLPATAAAAIYNAGQSTHLSVNMGAYDAYAGNLMAYYKMGSATVPAPDGTSNLLFDQTSPGVGLELLTNGDYSDASVPDTFNGSSQVNLAGWTSGGSTHTADAHFVITNGACQMDTDGTNVTISQGTTVVGKAYEYSLEITDYVTGGMTVAAGGVTVQANITSNGTYTGVFVATGTTAIDISRKFGAAAKMTIDNVSVKEINGHTGTISGASVVDNNVPRQVYALPPLTPNLKSIILDGTNDHILTNVDATAQANSTSRYYSFWFKSGSSTSHQPIFDHGDSNVGALHFNLSGNRAYIYMSNNSFRDFVDFAAQDDQAWHHFLVRIAFNDIANCELWCDGEKKAVNSTTDTGSMNEYTTGLRIGRGGSNYGNFSVDEFSIYGDLSNPSEVARALYNAGRPIDPSKSLGAANQPQLLRHYYRMGDASLDGTADGTNNIIFQGLEFEGDEMFPSNASSSDWASLNKMTWDGTTLSYAGTGGEQATAQYTFTLPVGQTFRLTVDIENDGTGNFFGRVGDGSNSLTLTNVTTGTYEVVHTVTESGANNTLFFIVNSSFSGTISNISLNRIRGQYIGAEEITNGDFSTDSDWTKGTGWTISGGVASIDGSQSGGVFLYQSAGLVDGKVYKVTFDVVSHSAGNVRVNVGGNTSGTYRSSTGTFTEYLVCDNTAVFYVQADSSFNGSIDNVSVKEVGGAAVMTNMTTSDIQTDTPY